MKEIDTSHSRLNSREGSTTRSTGSITRSTMRSTTREKKERGLASVKSTNKKPKGPQRKRTIMSEADTREVYFLGIIDILVQYGIKKRGEYVYKSKLRRLGDSVSVNKC